VLRCSCDRLTVAGDGGDHRVYVRPGGRNGEDLCRARCFVIGQHRIARLDLADGYRAVYLLRYVFIQEKFF
jgi:hypothetical protein